MKRKNGLALFLITGKTAIRNYYTDTKKEEFFSQSRRGSERNLITGTGSWEVCGWCGLKKPELLWPVLPLFCWTAGRYVWFLRLALQNPQEDLEMLFQSRGRPLRQASILKPLLAGMFSGWKKQCIHSFSLILVYASKSLWALQTLLV